jgi:ribose/xylose/arabinose/galactoside ABC-type transport system permease subunit
MDAQKSASTTLAAPRRTFGFRLGDEMALLQLIVAAMVIGTILQPAFLTKINLVNILQQSSELSVLY